VKNYIPPNSPPAGAGDFAPNNPPPAEGAGVVAGEEKIN